MIRRSQSAGGYPASGYLNQLQHKALLSEIVANAKAKPKNPKAIRVVITAV